MATREELNKLCNDLQDSQNPQEVAQLLIRQPLIVRSYFALLSACVPSISNKYSLAQKILQATRAPSAGKTIVTWNVNSLRANIIDNKPSQCKSTRVIDPAAPMGELITTTNPDIICLQETKLQDKHIECFNIAGYHTYWNCSSGRKGYSGVSIWSREQPISVSTELLGAPEELQNEGRILTAYYPGYVVVNTYTPNTLRAGIRPLKGWDTVKNGEERRVIYEKIVGKRESWDQAINNHLQILKDKEVGSVIWCGDMNIARGPKDIHNVEKTKARIDANDIIPSKKKQLERRYKEGQKALANGSSAGLRHEERKGLDRILSNGFRDVFRELHPNDYGFTYWDVQKVYFRGSNNGWRIDYFIVSDNLLACVESIDVYKSIGETPGTTKVASDHAPLVMKFYPNFNCEDDYVPEEGKQQEDKQVNFNDTASVYLSTSQRIKLSEAIRDTMSSIKKVHGEQCIEGAKAELLKKLEITKLLGSGSFGMVYAGCAPQPCDKNSYKFAVKLAKIAKGPFKIPFSTNQQPWHEILILRDIIAPLVTGGISPNLPLISDVFTCDSCKFELHGSKSKGPCMILLTELATGGALSDWLSKERSQEELYSCLFQVMAGIHALQCRGQIWNNDIKKENILCYKVKPGGYWEYQVHGQNFYVPNYGDLFIINDFGVSTTFNPNLPLVQAKKNKWKDLGMRFAMIIDGRYSPLNATTNWSYFKGTEIAPTNIAWGTPSTHMSGEQPYPLHCQNMDIKEHSKGGSSILELKSGKIKSVGLALTQEQETQLKYLSIPTDSSDPKFYMYPETIPPLEFRWDTQDAIRMFTGGDRASQPGGHKRPAHVNGEFLDQLKQYVFNTGVSGSSDSSVPRLRCAGAISPPPDFNIGAYNISPVTDIAGYFLTEFFTKMHDFTNPHEDEIVIATYLIS